MFFFLVGMLFLRVTCCISALSVTFFIGHFVFTVPERHDTSEDSSIGDVFEEPQLMEERLTKEE